MYNSSNLGVGTKAFPIVPHDSTNFSSRARAIYVGSAGNVTLVNSDGSSCLLANVPAGVLLPIECVRINATGTNASSLVGLV